MRDIRLDTVGEILAGVDAGRFVEIADDRATSGGFLVLVYSNADRSGEGFDSWVESLDDVDAYFEENGWDVRWI